MRTVPGPCAADQGTELQAFLRAVNNGWRVIDEHHLEKEYRFRNFREALDFAIRVGELAEEQRDHPDIFLAWAKSGSQSGRTRSIA